MVPGDRNVYRLRSLGKPVWLLQYNDEAHNLVKRQNRKDISIREAQFFGHFP
jgi:dipeptidyl aminopeptidase/acylaminoacyl peptidase